MSHHIAQINIGRLTAPINDCELLKHRLTSIYTPVWEIEVFLVLAA